MHAPFLISTVALVGLLSHLASGSGLHGHHSLTCSVQPAVGTVRALTYGWPYGYSSYYSGWPGLHAGYAPAFGGYPGIYPRRYILRRRLRPIIPLVGAGHGGNLPLVPTPVRIPVPIPVRGPGLVHHPTPIVAPIVHPPVTHPLPLPPVSHVDTSPIVQPYPSGPVQIGGVPSAGYPSGPAQIGGAPSVGYPSGPVQIGGAPSAGYPPGPVQIGGGPSAGYPSGPVQIGGIPSPGYPPVGVSHGPATSQVFHPSNGIGVGDYDRPYPPHQQNNGHLFQNEHGYQPNPVVIPQGVITPNEHQAAFPGYNEDGVIITAGGEGYPHSIGRETRKRAVTPNGVVTSNELVITRGGNLSSASRTFSNRVYSS